MSVVSSASSLSVVQRASTTTRAAAVPIDVTRLGDPAIAALTATQVASLSDANIQALTTAQVGLLSRSGVSGLKGSQTALMTTSQVAALKPTQMVMLSASAVSGLGGDDIAALSSAQVAAINTTAFRGLNAAALGALSNAQLSAVSAKAIAGLSAGQLNTLSAGQFSALGTGQLQALTTVQISGLSDAKIGALAVNHLTTAQIAKMSAATVSKLSATQLASLSTPQIGALSIAASSALTASQTANLSAAQAGAMKTTKVGMDGGLQINLIWATSASRAPAAFKTAVIAAAKSFTDTFANTAIINIQVGFGETNGQRVSASAVAQSISRGSYSTYAAVRGALLQDAGNSEYQASADATLTPIDPTGGGKFFLSTAQQKALGLMASNATTIDGYIGLSGALPMDFTHSGVAGRYDAIGAMQDEISEVMGRTASVGKAYGARVYTALDLFRYKTSPGGPARSLTAGTSGDYFSINGGAASLGAFNATTGSDDYADWSMAEAGDAYGFGAPGVKSTTPPRDMIAMAAIGYNFTPSGLAAVRSGNTDLVV